MGISRSDYASLLQNQESSSKEEFDSVDDESFTNSLDSVIQKKPFSWILSRKILVIHVGVVLIYTTIFAASLIYVFSQKAGDNPFCRKDIRATPLRGALLYESRVVEYDFDNVNAFKGPPLAEVDEAWLGLLNNPHEVRVSPDLMEESNLSSIQLADGSEEYIVQPIAYHMLHCLYTIHKYAHPDFYGPDLETPEKIIIHTDHCVDNLRKFVQCHADTGISTFKWLENRKIPAAILNTEETCVNWAAYDGWVQDHSVSMEDLKSFKDGHLLVHPTLGGLTHDDYFTADGKIRVKNETS